MHPTATQCPKANRRFPHMPLLALLLLTATFSLSCQQESNQNKEAQNRNVEAGNTAVPSPTSPLPVDPEPIVVTGGSLDLKLRPTGFSPNGDDSIFTCSNCRFSGSIEFRDLQTATSIPDCSIPSQIDGVIRIDAKGNKPNIVIAAADGNVTVSLDPAEYPKKGSDRWHRRSDHESHKIGGVFVKPRPTSTETTCQGIPQHGIVEVRITVLKR